MLFRSVDLKAVGTDEHKPFLEIAPWLVVLFKLMKDDAPDRMSDQVYYVNESVGIAAGMFLAAAHVAGLVTLTHTPSPMKFLSKILGRGEHERPFLLIPVGYPAAGATVQRKARAGMSAVAQSAALGRLESLRQCARHGQNLSRRKELDGVDDDNRSETPAEGSV